MAAPELGTARLILRPLTVADLVPIRALWMEPGVRRYLFDDTVVTAERARELLARSEADFERRRFGLWGLYSPGQDTLLGFSGLCDSGPMPEPELMFGLGEPWWGGGLAYEAADAVLRYGFDQLQLPLVGAATDLPNVRSIRLLARLGLRLLHQADLDGRPTLFYRLTDAEWRVSRCREGRDRPTQHQR